MSELIQILPIVLMAAIIGLIIFIIMRYGRHKNQRMMKGTQLNFVKRVQIMFAIYVSVLIISAGVYFFIPSEGESAVHEQIGNEDSRYLFESFLEGNIPASYDKYIKEKKSYVYKGEQITLKGLPNQEGMFDVNLFVDDKTELKNTIEAMYYQTPVAVFGRKVTQLPIPQIEMRSNVMTIHNPEQTEIDFSLFKKEFPYTQFTGENWWDDHINLGEQIILIRVPNGLELKFSTEMNVNYIGEMN
ncbi:hypothetical protein [Virgibacillus oceani]|uniref:Uncharacterized protein n=1 Tax=Virgibacillus oceani TaxID=1479511 RepID=A0A917M5J4_9BACI|nr:hypothetical protein [Virgibacillus oceani]GGG80424.1 hypothetical protein GCM10011398_27250 [Virgibacillus oceani]